MTARYPDSIVLTFAQLVHVGLSTTAAATQLGIPATTAPRMRARAVAAGWLTDRHGKHAAPLPGLLTTCPPTTLARIMAPAARRLSSDHRASRARYAIIAAMYYDGVTPREIADAFGIGATRVSQILRQKKRQSAPRRRQPLAPDPGGCRFIRNDCSQPGWAAWCGNPLTGRSYCAAHQAICYVAGTVAAT